MKHVKRIVGFVLALVMVLALSVGAFAAGNNTIKVTGAQAGETYRIYKMLDLSVNDDQTAYSYTVNSAWADFFKSPDGKDLTYVNIDTQGYVTWKDGADVAAFAKDAEAFAKGLNALETIAADKDGDITFSDLEAGYYLVTSTLGTKATVGTTPGTPNPVIQEKNEVPTNVKTVEEDSTGKYGSTNDADIGQTVNFKSTITAKPGAENYVFEDTMSAGLTYENDAKVYTDETMTTELADANYTVNNNPGDGKTFTITFQQSYLDMITVETKLYVKYSATLNESAVVGPGGNENKSTLKYGDASNTKSTPESETITYTWDLDVLKYGNGDTEKVLKDAQFVLLNNKNKDKVAAVVNGKLTDWVGVPVAGEDGTINWPENTVLTTNAQGKIKISGLDSDTYYLREIKAPAGYNALGQDVEVKITGATTKEDGSDSLTYTTVVAEINNQSGTELPSTGGMGTTVFYILGSVLVLGAAVVLVTRKRMKEHN
ncbi:MAG: SpaH/EbpB family LPXTG-anchored major pilin [Clostridiales bacterium]|nr:SpaH/EbpB family LPXTG-anchored major pilin [Clostridiales bacterium]